MNSPFRKPSQSDPETPASGDNGGRRSGQEGEVLVGELAQGTVVGDKYVVTGLLGSGASGAVYEAQHREIGHRVAIKVVHRALATRDDIIARFKLEAKVCGSMRDKHVGQVYDVGQLQDGSPYMVMELQEGTSLESLLQAGRLPIATAVDAARQLLSGLNAAHQLGVVHRDVKPGNLMISRESTGEVVLKLVDFGISKAIAPDISERTVTLEGTVLGSPDYMSPEQLRGSDIDQRSDIYAVGVVLYQAVTGRLPFDAPSLTELMASILRDPVTPPSELRAGCPPALEQIIQRAMFRNKTQRFESASQMADALASMAASYGLAQGLDAWKEAGALLPALTAAIASTPAPGSEGEATDTWQNGHARGAQAQAAHPSSQRNGYAVETSGMRTLALRLPRPRRWPLFVGAAVGLSALGLFVAFQDQAPDREPPNEVTPTLRSTAVSHPDIDPQLAKQPLFKGRQSTAQESSQSGSAPQGAETSGTGRPGSAAPASAAVGQNNAAESRHPGVAPSGSGDKSRARRARNKPPSSPRKAEAPASVAASVTGNAPAATAAPSIPTAPEQPASADDSAPAASVNDILMQASAAYVRGQIPVARALYRKVVQRAPRNAAAWRGLGMASSRMGQPKEAIRAFERYLELRPSAGDAASIRKKLQQLQQ